MGKMNQFHVIAFVIVNLSVTHYEAEFWQKSVSVTLLSPLLLCDKYNDQCFVMLLFVSERLKISWTLQNVKLKSEHLAGSWFTLHHFKCFCWISVKKKKNTHLCVKIWRIKYNFGLISFIHSFILPVRKDIFTSLRQCWLVAMLVHQPQCIHTIIPFTRGQFHFPLRVQVWMHAHHINSLLCLNTH